MPFICDVPNTGGFVTIYGCVEKRLQLTFWAKTNRAKIGMTDCSNKHQAILQRVCKSELSPVFSYITLTHSKALIFSSELLISFLHHCHCLTIKWDPLEEKMVRHLFAINQNYKYFIGNLVCLHCLNHSSCYFKWPQKLEYRTILHSYTEQLKKNPLNIISVHTTFSC